MTNIKNIVINGVHGRPIVMDVRYVISNEPKPIIIFCHGYKGFKDWGAWNIMADAFVETGFCFIKFNFSHNGGTVEQPIDFPDLEAFGNNNYSIELNDLNSVINWVCEDSNLIKEGDINKIALLGHSRGGAIATIKAEEDTRIKHIVSLAGVSDFKARFNEESHEMDTWKKTRVKYIENGRTKQQMPHYYQFYEDFIKNEKRLTIKRAVENLQIPHLIIHGSQDNSVLLEEAKNLHRWNPKSRLEIIDGANHVFGTHHPWGKDILSKELQFTVNTTIKFINETNLS